MIVDHLEEYTTLLMSHDWMFQMADDHRAYAAGSKTLAQLRKLQSIVDKDYSIWIKHAPSEFHPSPITMRDACMTALLALTRDDLAPGYKEAAIESLRTVLKNNK